MSWDTGTAPRPNYITEHRSFLRDATCARLSGTAQLLYIHLLDIFNEHGWPERLNISNAKLADRMGCSDESILRARRQLVKMGRVWYKGQRRLHPLYGIYYYSMPVEKDVDTPVENLGETCGGRAVETSAPGPVEQAVERIVEPCVKHRGGSGNREGGEMAAEGAGYAPKPGTGKAAGESGAEGDAQGRAACVGVGEGCPSRCRTGEAWYCEYQGNGSREGPQGRFEARSQLSVVQGAQSGEGPGKGSGKNQHLIKTVEERETINTAIMGVEQPVEQGVEYPVENAVEYRVDYPVEYGVETYQTETPNQRANSSSSSSAREAQRRRERLRGRLSAHLYPPGPVEDELVQAWAGDFAPEVVEDMLLLALKRNKRSYRYLEVGLERLKAQGITTLDAYQRHEAAFQQARRMPPVEAGCTMASAAAGQGPPVYFARHNSRPVREVAQHRYSGQRSYTPDQWEALVTDIFALE